MSLWILNSIVSIASVNQVLYACTISVHETCKKTVNLFMKINYLKLSFIKKKYYVHKSCIPIVLNVTLNWYITLSSVLSPLTHKTKHLNLESNFLM